MDSSATAETGRTARKTPRAASIAACCPSIEAFAAPLISRSYPMNSATQDDQNLDNYAVQRVQAARDIAFWRQWGSDAGSRARDITQHPRAAITPIDVRRLTTCISKTVCFRSLGSRDCGADPRGYPPRRWIGCAIALAAGPSPSSSRRVLPIHLSSCTLCTQESRRR